MSLFKLVIKYCKGTSKTLFRRSVSRAQRGSFKGREGFDKQGQYPTPAKASGYFDIFRWLKVTSLHLVSLFIYLSRLK